MDEDGIKNNLIELSKGYGIVEVDVFKSSVVIEQHYYESALGLYGFGRCDLLIIPNCPTLSEELVINNMYPFKDKKENGYNYQNKTYGYNVHEKNSGDSYLHGYASAELNENYYLFINIKSAHYNDYIKNPTSLLNSVISWIME